MARQRAPGSSLPSSGAPHSQTRDKRSRKSGVVVRLSTHDYLKRQRLEGAADGNETSPPPTPTPVQPPGDNVAEREAAHVGAEPSADSHAATSVQPVRPTETPPAPAPAPGEARPERKQRADVCGGDLVIRIHSVAALQAEVARLHERVEKQQRESEWLHAKYQRLCALLLHAARAEKTDARYADNVGYDGGAGVGPASPCSPCAACTTAAACAAAPNAAARVRRDLGSEARARRRKLLEEIAREHGTAAAAAEADGVSRRDTGDAQ